MIQQGVSSRLDALHKGAEPRCADEDEYCWTILALITENLRQVESEYLQLSELGLETL
jgi:hypothetical protein